MERVEYGREGPREAVASEQDKVPPLSKARLRLVQAAEGVFAEKGFHGASIRDIAHAAGLSKASVLHHYESKEALYGAVLQRIATSLEGLRSEIGGVSETATALEVLIDGFLDWSLAEPCYGAIMLRELMDNAGHAASARNWYLADFVNVSATLIARAQRRGLVAAGQPVLFLEVLLSLPAYHRAGGPTRRRIIGEAACAQADLAFRDEAAMLVRRAWGIGG